MAKIIRRPDRAEGGLTPEEKARMALVAQEWIGIALRTDPIDPARIVPAIHGLYEAAGLAPPRVVIVPSPLVMAFAYGAAAWIWHCRGTATADATRAATLAATADATDDATADATDDATADATRAATYDATADATRAATYVATAAATRAATLAATAAATADATDDATAAATLAATYVATRAATADAEACHILAGAGGLECAKLWYRSHQGGNMWAGWCAYLVAARDVLGLRLAPHEKFKSYEQAAREGGFRVLHEKFCLVSDFPAEIHQDDQHRPHSDTGPSHRWRDGWCLWHVHGVRVTEQIVMRPATLTVAQIEAEPNAEVRRVMIERFGMQRFVQESGAILVHSIGDDHALIGLRGARLWRKEVSGDEPILALEMVNSTPEPDGQRKRYLIRVDPNAYAGDAARDCLAAMASTYRMPDGSLLFGVPQDYAPSCET